MTKLEVGKEYWFKGKVTQVDEGDFQPYKVRFGDECFADYIWITEQVEKAEAVPEREKVTIPKEVAEWIEEHEGQFSTVYTAFSILTKREYGIKKWVNDNQDTFARAWLDGYKVEKELLYWVRDKRDDPILLKWSTGGITTGASSVDKATQRKHKEIYTFTEKEIKDYDERYWAFAVPVEEDDE